MKNNTTTALQEAKELVNWMSANKIQAVLTMMVYATGGTKQFESQVAQWLSENPEIMAKLQAQRDA